MISSCQVTISVATRSRGHSIQRKVLVDKSVQILFESEALVEFVCSSFPDDQDFLFNLTSYSHLILFSHILNNSTRRVLVPNALHQPVLLPCHQQLGMLIEISYDNCFQVALANHQAGIRVPTIEHGL